MKKFAFVFPGQGCQAPGMGQNIYNSYPEAKEAFEKASASIGMDMAKLCFETDEATLALTENTQPAIFTVSMAMASILTSKGITPSAVAGLSLGEYSALATAGAITLEDGVKLVQKRGKLMQEEVPSGKGSLMAVMGLTHSQIQETIAPLTQKGIISCSNINTDNQIVIGGEIELLQEAEALLKSAGAKRALMLNVSAPFHTQMLKGAGIKLFDELQKIEIKPPNSDYYPNVKGKLQETSSENSKEIISTLLKEQVYSPVLWTDTVRNMINDGITTFVEIYPGNVVGSLIKKIDKNVEVISLAKLEDLETFLAENGN